MKTWGPQMRLFLFAIVSAFLIAAGAQAKGEIGQKTELLSIQGVSLPANWVVSNFRVKTWGVLPLATCHIPPAWRITAGKDSDPEGVLAGEGDTFGSLLNGPELGKVTFLVIVEEYQPLPRGNPKGEYHPATFSGTITIETFGDTKPRTIRLTPANFVRVSAAGCPRE